MVKDKKRRLEYRARREAALPILVWKTFWRIRRVLYQQFKYGGEEEEDDASIPAPWTDADEAGLVAPRNVPIEMADTLYGRFLATKKRIPSLKNTPHHALAVSSHRLNMGGAFPPAAVSLLCPSLPQWGMGGDMTVAVARSHHILQVCLAALHRGPLPSPRRIHPLLVLRFSTGEDLIPQTFIQTAARIHRSGAAPPPTQPSTVLLRLEEPHLPPLRLVLRPLRALSPFPLWRPSPFPRSRTPPTTFKRASSSFTGSVAQAILLHAPTQPLLRTRGTLLPASSGRARSGPH